VQVLAGHGSGAQVLAGLGQRAQVNGSSCSLMGESSHARMTADAPCTV
jgi:hypothetical protein